MPYIYGTKQQAGVAVVRITMQAEGSRPARCPQYPGCDAYHWHDTAYAAPGAALPAGATALTPVAPYGSIEIGDAQHYAGRKGTAPLKYHYSVYNDGAVRRIFLVSYSPAHNRDIDCSESIPWHALCNELYEHVTTNPPPFLYSNVIPPGAVLIATR